MSEVLSVLNTRPDAVETAPVFWELQKYPEQFRGCVLIAAQRRQMLGLVYARQCGKIAKVP